MPQINVYGADACQDTETTREHLQSRGIPHRYHNIEEDSSADERVRAWNDGKRRTPTVLIVDSQVETLSVPSNQELDEALQRHGLLGHGGQKAV
jgi:mycoredoxin